MNNIFSVMAYVKRWRQPGGSQSIAQLVTSAGIFSQKMAVQTVSTSIRPTIAAAEYSISDGSVADDGSSILLVLVAHFTDASAAQDAMRQHLATFDADVSLVAKKTAKSCAPPAPICGLDAAPSDTKPLSQVWLPNRHYYLLGVPKTLDLPLQPSAPASPGSGTLGTITRQGDNGIDINTSLTAI
ncbi:hypothetical protein B0T26DRAFT_673533 [Lasiosphaeria miniovina]|uniref:Uncharacterized protein n=1 Tax=Lasiosphaeria miniovina TaxID=1954250 RepID=A0AA40DZ05_9PEZI|nr:uncharacterized protein B0T26DRAFT_673533 [Lasiosphaeria miniovina]KAK0721744.1 hypothetical protein B0T26DRAFT_673533 [Lasiosphaeria miniovina]